MFMLGRMQGAMSFPASAKVLVESLPALGLRSIIRLGTRCWPEAVKEREEDSNWCW